MRPNGGPKGLGTWRKEDYALNEIYVNEGFFSFFLEGCTSFAYKGEEKFLSRDRKVWQKGRQFCCMQVRNRFAGDPQARHVISSVQ
jgi:hypothetical protein